MCKLFKAWRRYRSAEDGAVTVEAVIWLPVFFGIVVLVADVSLLFNQQAQMLRFVQDANRAYSTGQLETTGEIQTYLTSVVADRTNRATVSSSIDTSYVPAGIVSTTLTIPAADLASLGLIASLVNFDMSVTGNHYIEY